MDKRFESRSQQSTAKGTGGWLWLAGLIIFLVSVVAFADARAQTVLPQLQLRNSAPVVGAGALPMGNISD